MTCSELRARAACAMHQLPKSECQRSSPRQASHPKKNQIPTITYLCFPGRERRSAIQQACRPASASHSLEFSWCSRRRAWRSLLGQLWSCALLDEGEFTSLLPCNRWFFTACVVPHQSYCCPKRATQEQRNGNALKTTHRPLFSILMDPLFPPPHPPGWGPPPQMHLHRVLPRLSLERWHLQEAVAAFLRFCATDQLDEGITPREVEVILSVANFYGNDYLVQVCNFTWGCLLPSVKEPGEECLH